ncbi:MAG: hypothetical protein AABY04_00120, partial [Candidatus Micrarchaeota archaeon]
MLPIGKFLEPNYGKLVGFFISMAIIFYFASPLLSVPCYYGFDCKIKDVACVSSAYDALSVCERSKTIYSLAFSLIAYLL